MNKTLEQDYYESDSFWKDGMLEDPANQTRVRTTADMIPTSVHSLLDVGCGNGVFVHLVSKTRPEIDITATDRSEAALKYVRTRKHVSEITDLGIGKNRYDCVTCLQVLEHIPHSIYSQALESLKTASKKYLLVSVPFREDLENNFTRCPKCRSCFNSDLHFRNYDIDNINGLFGSSFRLIASRNVVEREVSYVSLMAASLMKYFRRHKENSFRSPVCPICSYENEAFALDMGAKSRATKTGKYGKSRLKDFLKRLSPKKKIPGFWVIALFEKQAG